MAEAEGVEIFHELTVIRNSESRHRYGISSQAGAYQIDPTREWCGDRNSHQFTGAPGDSAFEGSVVAAGYAAIPTRQQGVCIR